MLLVCEGRSAFPFRANIAHRQLSQWRSPRMIGALAVDVGIFSPSITRIDESCLLLSWRQTSQRQIYFPHTLTWVSPYSQHHIVVESYLEYRNPISRDGTRDRTGRNRTLERVDAYSTEPASRSGCWIEIGEKHFCYIKRWEKERETEDSCYSDRTFRMFHHLVLPPLHRATLYIFATVSRTYST